MSSYGFRFGFGFSGGGAGVTPPGGTSGEVQFNDSGVFGGIATSVFDKSTQSLSFAFSGASSGFEINPDDGGANSTNSIFSGASIALSSSGGTSLTLDNSGVSTVLGSITSVFSVKDSGSSPIIQATHDTKLGFFAAPPIAKPTVTGAKLPSDVVMASLLTALKNLGLITDSTT